MTTTVINEKQLQRFSEGIVSKVRATLRAIQGLNNQIFYTGSDIAYEMIRRFHSGMEVDQVTFAALAGKCGGALAQAMKGDDSIYRTDDKIPSLIAHAHYKVKTGYGYRIGAPITALMNADMATEKRIFEQAAKQVASNPLESILPVIPMLTMADLTRLAIEVLAAKDNLYLKMQESQFNAAMRNPRETKGVDHAEVIA